MAKAERKRRLGVAIVGVGGAVATTAAAGVELLRAGLVGTEGLPLAGLPAEQVGELVDYTSLVIRGWDLHPQDLAEAAREHEVLTATQLAAVGEALGHVRPWQAAGSTAFCRNIDDGARLAGGHRAVVERIRADLRAFREGSEVDAVVVVNLASTERRVDLGHASFASIEAFEAALGRDAPEVGPAMLYAYAALLEGAPYANFTPSVAADLPALIALAEARGVPVCGKDGKTGQTMIKTVLAPAFRARALRVDGWYSTNILGNRDGLALDDPESLAAKRATKGAALDSLLGYHVADHLVDIRYYRPRGDEKEAWDNIDVTGFLGQRMQIKVNFLCRDSILAAPLVLELARLLDLAMRRGQGGVQHQLGSFFKSPMTSSPEQTPEHALHAQQTALLHWLAAGSRP